MNGFKKKRRKRSQKQIQKDKTWAACSKYVRIRDANMQGYEECYTCGKFGYWKEMQAGHAFGGRGGSVLFDTDIIKPQCYACNCINHGKYDIFIPKLERERGSKFIQEKSREQSQDKEYSLEELKAKEEDFKLRTVQLKNYDLII
jgi:hypothetical protein